MAHARASFSAEAAASRTKKPEGDNVAGASEIAVDDSALAPTTRTKKLEVENGVGPREKAVDDSALSRPRKKLASVAGQVAGTPAAAAHLHCPRCGFHIGALQTVVTLPAPSPSPS